MNKKVPLSLVVMVTCLIIGNVIGAGILGLPIKTGPAGFIPSLIGMLVVGFFLFFTAIVLSEETLRVRKEIFHYPSLYQEYFGSVGKWIATAANLVIFYGLLTVYIAGSAAIMIEILNIPIPEPVAILVFFVIFTGITIANPKVFLKYNSFFVALLLISFIVMVIMGERYVDPSRLAYKNWQMLPVGLPIIVMAVNFHNIIPTICKELGWDRKAVFVAILSGIIIGCFMNIIWIQVGIGVLPLQGNNGIMDALQNNLPATVPLVEAIKTPLFLQASLIFAFVAIITSYISTGNALMDFIEDLTVNYAGIRNRILTIAISFAPPLIISIVYPNIFLDMLDIAGGIGMVVLFGIFPSVLFLMREKSLKKRLLLAVPAFMLFVVILFFKIEQECGLSPLHERVEYSTNLRFYTKSLFQKDRKGPRKKISETLPVKIGDVSKGSAPYHNLP